MQSQRMEEVDELTAQVVLNSGASTDQFNFDLRDESSSSEAGPSGSSRSRRGLDFTDCRPKNIRVATYIESGDINIFVRTIQGETINIRIPRVSYVEDLKTKITQQTKIQKCDYYLTFGGKTLDNDTTLKRYGLENNSNVTMRMRLRGG